MCLEFLVPRNCYAVIVNCNKECESWGIKDWEINWNHPLKHRTKTK